MKRYPSIPGPSKSPNAPCIAFYKYDGVNFRAEWSRKRGWYKFGSRNVLIDRDHPFGSAIQLFLDKYAKDLPLVFKNKYFKGIDSFIVYCEIWSANSIAGHFPQSDGTLRVQLSDIEPNNVTLFDVNANKRGIVLPRDFVKLFGHLDIPEIVYEGNFNRQFIEDVRKNAFNIKEGVVAKGTNVTQHRLWMAKCKTNWWFEEIKRLAEANEIIAKTLRENSIEQNAL